MKTKNQTLLLRTTLTGFVILIFNLSMVAQMVKDADGNSYKTAKLGRQEWMASNLNVAHFRNGDPIPEAKTVQEWRKADSLKRPAWCYYELNPENGAKYGKLYNWHAINDKRGLAPADFRIPTNAEWQMLVKNLLGVDVAGAKLKSKTGWKANAVGSDNIGFSALPGGLRAPDGKFHSIGSKGQWWSNSGEVRKTEMIYSISLDDSSPEFKYFKMEKGNGLSVRCVKDIK